MVQGGAVSPIVTIEPRRRKFHKAITITMPLPERMSAQYLRRRQNESLKLSQKQQGKTPIGSFFLTLHMYFLLLYYLAHRIQQPISNLQIMIIRDKFEQI